MLLPNDDSHEYCFVFLKKNVGQSGGIPGLDLNVEDAWAQGYTGKGITTAIMDDGKNRSIHTVQMWIGLFLVHLKVNEKNPQPTPPSLYYQLFGRPEIKFILGLNYSFNVWVSKYEMETE